MTDAITADVREPLWSDARIDKAAMDDWNYSTSYEAARSALRRMRDEYSARIAQLEQERDELRATLAAVEAERVRLQVALWGTLFDAEGDMSSPELDGSAFLHDEALLRNSGSCE